MFKILQQFSAKGRRIVKLSNMIKLLNPPAPMEDPLPHDSEGMLASGLFTKSYLFINYDTVSMQE